MAGNNEAGLAELTRLKAVVEQANQEAQRAAGAKQEVLARLEREFGCKSLEAAEKLLKRTDRDAARAWDTFAKALEKYKAEHGV